MERYDVAQIRIDPADGGPAAHKPQRGLFAKGGSQASIVPIIFSTFEAHDPQVGGPF